MANLDAVLQAAYDDKVIAGAVVLAKDITGNFEFTKSFGVRTTIDGSEKPLDLDAIVYLASCTKLMTTIAALQCIERGLIALTEDVSRIVPELGNVEILTREDASDGPPTLQKRTRTITLERLLTHSSGFVYALMEPLVKEWQAEKGVTPTQGGTVEERFSYPLTFEPGSSWTYGAGIDWAGKIVERLVGETLETYMQTHIWQPLGIKDITFWPMKDPAFQARMVDFNPLDPKGRGIACSGGADIQGEATECMGGQGGYASLPDYVKILQSILINDEKILKKATVEEMFKPHLTEASKAAMQGIMTGPEGFFYSQLTPRDTQRDFGLGGLLVEEDVPNLYGKGTLTWSGGINSTWFMDRKNGLCGYIAPQLLVPANFEKSLEVRVACRDRIYMEFTDWKKNTKSMED